MIMTMKIKFFYASLPSTFLYLVSILSLLEFWSKIALFSESLDDIRLSIVVKNK